MGGGLILGRVFGVQIQVDWSLLIIFTLVTVSLGSALFPAWHPDWPPALTWGVALGAAVLFFASILAHELSHALVARAQGIPVRRVTLFLFGGIAHLESEPRSPKAEFAMAIVGPIVSIAIGVLAWVAGSLLAGRTLAVAGDDAVRTMSAVGPVATLLLWLGPVNVGLGVFNMVPGFPLDGGRVLRSFLWWSTGDLLKATRWAAGAGQAVAWGLMGLGGWNLLVGGSTHGLWLLLIGWFLNNAARASYRQLLVRQALENVSVGELMLTRLDHVPAEATAQQLIDDYFMTSDQRAFPVDAPDGTFLGLVCLDDVRRLSPEQRGRTTAAELMTRASELITLPPDAEAERALDQMARRDVDQIPVVDGGTLVGLVRRRDILKWLALRSSETGLDAAEVARAAG
jgi:Zn-dependent protease